MLISWFYYAYLKVTGFFCVLWDEEREGVNFKEYFVM